MSYVDAPATKMLATHCCVCGLPLVDAISVELGIGPDCRQHMNGDISEEQRKECNRLTHLASLAAQEGKVDEVRRCSEAIIALGLSTLGEKVAERFVNAEKNAKISIVEEDGYLVVSTPFRRKVSNDFIDAWRQIPGRRYRDKKNLIPLEQKRALWGLLQRFFPNEYAMGPKGVFRIPKAEAA